MTLTNGNNEEIYYYFKNNILYKTLFDYSDKLIMVTVLVDQLLVVQDTYVANVLYVQTCQQLIVNVVQDTHKVLMAV